MGGPEPSKLLFLEMKASEGLLEGFVLVLALIKERCSRDPAELQRTVQLDEILQHGYQDYCWFLCNLH